MRVVVAGQKRFGRDVLELVRSRGYEIAAVSAPDEEDDKLRIAALNHALPVIPPRGLCSATMPRGCDLIVAAHCHTFISAKTRSLATLGALGFHPSLLPMHRGRSSIEWTLRFRERIAGGSIYWLNDVVDGGPIAAQDWCFVEPGETAGKLWARELAPMGLRLFSRVFDALDRKIVIAEPQRVELATWEPAIDNVPPLWRPDVPLLGASEYQTLLDARSFIPPA